MELWHYLKIIIKRGQIKEREEEERLGYDKENFMNMLMLFTSTLNGYCNIPLTTHIRIFVIARHCSPCLKEPPLLYPKWEWTHISFGMTVSLSASNLVFFFLSNSNKASVLYIVINRSRAKEQGAFPSLSVLLILLLLVVTAVLCL